MRSYYEDLRIYLKDQHFSNLHEHWYNFFLNTSDYFNANRFQFLQGFPTFNQMNNFHIVQDLLSDSHAVYSYKSGESKRLSQVYGELIALLEQKIDNRIEDQFAINLESWSVYRTRQKELNKRTDYQTEDLFAEWIGLMGFANRDMDNFFRTYCKHPTNKQILQAIDNYYNSWNYQAGVPTYQSSADLKERFIDQKGEEIKIDFHSSSSYPNPPNAWYNKKINHEGLFFESPVQEALESINKKAGQATVSVKGKLFGLKALPIETSHWFDESLLNLLLKEGQGSLNPTERGMYRDLLHHRSQELYLINGFDLCIEVMSHFKQKDLERLKASKIKCFPFYFDSNINCRQQIERKGDGSLKIEISCDKNEPIIIGCGIKKMIGS